MWACDDADADDFAESLRCCFAGFGRGFDCGDIAGDAVVIGIVDTVDIGKSIIYKAQ